jgi:predicted nucleotidyltransferase component of viral defense system
LINDIYNSQIKIILEVLPFVNKKKVFSLKGGTALNLFFWDMPRLSVDIDLCYLPIENRQETYTSIHHNLLELKNDIEQQLKCKVFSSFPLDGKREAKLVLEKNGINIKIEPNYILRGSLFEPVTLPISSVASSMYNVEVECKCLSKADLFAGKICAALDRQHPRDLFDIYQFLKNDNWDEQITEAFIFYLISHNRPIHELITPNIQPIMSIFKSEFLGMTRQKITLNELESARTELITKVNNVFSDVNKEFLVSIASGSPKWNLYSYPKIKDWPSVRWKLLNINKMGKTKKERQVLELKKALKL